ncbi:MAG: hypothetical protein GY754_36765 [bacterium]|nr:hypothetical protein [bacterium]
MIDIKKIILLICLLVPAGLAAQNIVIPPIEDSESEKRTVVTNMGSKAKEDRSGELRNKIMVYGGTHNYLYGYSDQRYREDDKGDYITTGSQQFGMEIYYTGFSNVHRNMENIRFGGSLSGYRTADITEVNLYAVNDHSISAETFPESINDRRQKVRFFLGAFVGIDKKWFGIDLGLTFDIEIFYENKREKLTEGSSPGNETYTKVDGRGLVPDKTRFHPNALLRILPADSIHFTIGYMREDFDPLYGHLQTKIAFPIGKYFQLNVGGYIYEKSGVFIEPIAKFKGFSLGFKGGTFINYQDDNLSKVGLGDSLFWQTSLSYQW